MSTRRHFLKSILIAGIAPAIVKAEHIMRIRPPDIWVPDFHTFNTKEGTVLFTFSRSTVATYEDYEGIIQVASINVQRPPPNRSIL